MKVGDLVKIDIGPATATCPGYRVGVITGFDSDDDPIVCWYDLKPKTNAFYHYHVEVINEAI